MYTLSILLLVILAISYTATLKVDWSNVKTKLAYREPLKSAPLSQSPNSRITNGEFVTEKLLPKFKYQVGLFSTFKKGDDSGEWCGGALIHERWVLTACHCVKDKAYSYIFFGFLDRNDEPNKNGRLLLEVSSDNYIVHKEYDPVELHQDIALIQLPKAVKFSNTIGKIAIDKDPSITKYNGKSCIISGWGATVDGGEVTSSLQFTTVKIMSNDECKKSFGDILPSQICQSVTNNQGICQGDSGGPIVFIKKGGIPELVGVSSFTALNGCNTNHPRVYTRCGQFKKWICDNTKKAVC